MQIYITVLAESEVCLLIFLIRKSVGRNALLKIRNVVGVSTNNTKIRRSKYLVLF